MPLLAALLLSLGAIASAGDAAPAESLFTRLGGTERVEAFVNATIDELAAESGADALRDGRGDEVKADLLARICAVSGGGCRYRMNAHKAAALPAGTALVEALRMAMRTHGVPLAARNELIEALAATQRDLARL